MNNALRTLTARGYFLFLETNTVDAVKQLLDVIALVKSINHRSHIRDLIS